MTNKLNDEIEKNNQEIEESAEELEPASIGSSADSNTDSDATSDDIIFDEDSELGDNQVVKKLREKLKLAIEEKQTYLDGWQRDKAEFINIRKRDDEARNEFLKFAKQGTIEEILPVLDSFDMAMANKASWDTVSAEWRAGMEGIYNQLLGILTKNSVVAFGANGDSFDPNLHQSVSMVTTEDKSQDHTVAEVLQKGYMLAGRVIRPAMVQVYEAAV
ncbi:MAG: nucleotide exchange factor GrpE [Candidatus Pacebacteria bacterium]|nr:nucleotide exchange factor GrpE [Candidatus Paceibacterota bacterium]